MRYTSFSPNMPLITLVTLIYILEVDLCPFFLFLVCFLKQSFVFLSPCKMHYLILSYSFISVRFDFFSISLSVHALSIPFWFGFLTYLLISLYFCLHVKCIIWSFLSLLFMFFVTLSICFSISAWFLPLPFLSIFGLFV